jgi:hypothetical protein
MATTHRHGLPLHSIRSAADASRPEGAMPKTGERRPLGQNRRDFMKAGGAVTAALLAQGALPGPARALPDLPSNPSTGGAMPTRNLGRTGFRVGVFSLGGQAAIERGDNEAVAVPLVERALDPA